jgi:hypothetical protein
MYVPNNRALEYTKQKIDGTTGGNRLMYNY